MVARSCSVKTQTKSKHCDSATSASKRKKWSISPAVPKACGSCHRTETTEGRPREQDEEMHGWKQSRGARQLLVLLSWQCAARTVKKGPLLCSQEPAAVFHLIFPLYKFSIWQCTQAGWYFFFLKITKLHSFIVIEKNNSTLHKCVKLNNKQ